MSPKQRAFVDAYLRLGQAQPAAREAGYAESFVLKRAGSLLKNPLITEEIKRRRQVLNQKAEKSATDVVNEYARIAFTDRTSFLKPDEQFPGSLIYKAPEELTDDQKALVEKVTSSWHTRTRVIDGEKVEIHRMEYNYVLLDKANALQQMGRHFGIFDDKLKLVGVQRNPFVNATPEQLQKLRESFVNVMSDGRLIEGEAQEVKK